MPVHVDHENRTAMLHGQRSTYAMAWDVEWSPLRHLHWGRRLDSRDAAALRAIEPGGQRFGAVSRPRSSSEEYPYWGGLRREEVALKATMPDGVRSLDLAVESVSQEDERLIIELRDAQYPVAVVLSYEVCPASDAITRSATIRNIGTGDAGVIRLDRAASASWPLPARTDWHITTATGTYGAEFAVRRRPVAQGTFALASRHGITGHDALPWVAFDLDAGLHHGEVWAMTLGWSGSWSISTNVAQDGAIHVVGGLENSDLDVALGPGEEVVLPPMTAVYSDEGCSGAARALHRYAREHVVVEPERLRPVLYNSWEATYFEVSSQQQMELATVAADLGAELFVVDDGWFHGRDDDSRGLGDWWPDEDKFPDGLEPLAEYVREVGMDFGIWVEPEMVNPDSDLYRAHPDWIHRWATRTPTLQRNQYVLDFGRTEVRHWALETLSTLVETLGLKYLKWDMNRPIAEPAGPNAVQAHTLGVYEVWDALRTRFPSLWLEDCASGGGRSDYGALSRCHWAWTSDATDAVERISIQHGFAQVHPAATMACWVTDVPNALTTRVTPLAFRLHVAMSGGVLGVGMDLLGLQPGEREVLRAGIAQYKRIRPTISNGVSWELPAPGPGMVARAYVEPDQSSAVAFAYGSRIGYGHGALQLRVNGLEPHARYRASVLEGSSDSGADGIVASGAWLESVGLPLAAQGDYASWVVRLARERD